MSICRYTDTQSLQKRKNSILPITIRPNCPFIILPLFFLKAKYSFEPLVNKG